MLLGKGASVNLTNQNRDSPLHRAASKGPSSSVQHLLDKGAGLGSRNSCGKTPVDLASVRMRHKIVTLLRVEATRRGECEDVAVGQHGSLDARSLSFFLMLRFVRMVVAPLLFVPVGVVIIETIKDDRCHEHIAPLCFPNPDPKPNTRLDELTASNAVNLPTNPDISQDQGNSPI